jgi:ribosomal protein S18 acetylase RimI-like enzyme
MRKLFPSEIRVVEEKDRDWVMEVINTHWGEDFVVLDGEIFYPYLLPGFIADSKNTESVGLVTYQIRGDVCEIITLNSLIENRGVGTKLIDAVVNEAAESGCNRLCLTTTNDNQQAIEFYRNRGFRLKEIRKGAVARAREIKPTIPELSPQGIPICDEWEFIMDLPRTD